MRYLSYALWLALAGVLIYTGVSLEKKLYTEKYILMCEGGMVNYNDRLGKLLDDENLIVLMRDCPRVVEALR